MGSDQKKFHALGHGMIGLFTNVLPRGHGDLPPRMIGHDAVHQGEEGIIASHPHVLRGLEPCTALADQYSASGYGLTRISLDPTKLRIGIPSVSR
jgi:hypothetical protein